MLPMPTFQLHLEQNHPWRRLPATSAGILRDSHPYHSACRDCRLCANAGDLEFAHENGTEACFAGNIRIRCFVSLNGP